MLNTVMDMLDGGNSLWTFQVGAEERAVPKTFPSIVCSGRDTAASKVCNNTVYMRHHLRAALPGERTPLRATLATLTL